MTTVVSPASAPIEITVAAQSTPLLGERRREVGLLAGLRELRVLHHAGQHHGDRDVEDGDDRQRAENAAGHVALRVLGLLGGGGDDVEADEREEHDRRAGQQPVPAVVTALGAGEEREQRLL